MSNKPYSVWAADSLMQRKGNFGKVWAYDYGVVFKGLEEVYRKTGDVKYLEYIETSLNKYVKADGSIKYYTLDETNIDYINNGKTVLFLYNTLEDAKKERYAKAAATLRHQLSVHPRTSEGAFWHKQVYPNQIWLDGVYMGSPFYAQYIRDIEKGDDYSDVVKQFVLCFKHTYDEKTGLLYHAWDETKEVFWCDKQTGRSPNFWSRAIGWYAMACADVLDYLPENDPGRPQILEIYKKVVDGMLRHVNDAGVLHQIPNMPGKKGNYLESSSTCMMVCAVAKGIVRGHLSREKYIDAVKHSYQGILDEFITITNEGLVNLNKTCSGAGLGPAAHIVREGLPASVNLARDGSFEYYISEPIVTNDPKGYGAFIMAAKFVEEL